MIMNMSMSRTAAVMLIEGWVDGNTSRQLIATGTTTRQWSIAIGRIETSPQSIDVRPTYMTTMIHSASVSAVRTLGRGGCCHYLCLGREFLLAPGFDGGTAKVIVSHLAIPVASS
jgi:uncharacterized membrane protein